MSANTYWYMHLLSHRKNENQQESIPVGCIPSAEVAIFPAMHTTPNLPHHAFLATHAPTIHAPATPLHTPLLPCIPPAMYAPLPHIPPPYMALPCTPLPHTAPPMHTPPPCTPPSPTMHTPPPCVPPCEQYHRCLSKYNFAPTSLWAVTRRHFSRIPTTQFPIVCAS